MGTKARRIAPTLAGALILFTQAGAAQPRGAGLYDRVRGAVAQAGLPVSEAGSVAGAAPAVEAKEPRLMTERKGESRFDTVARLFSAGELPRPERLYGWYVGRCFSDRDPNWSRSAFFVGNPVPVSEQHNDGPLFPALRPGIKLMVSYRDDTYSDGIDQRERDEIDTWVSRTGKATTIAIEAGNALVSSRDSGWSISVRVSAGYIVARKSDGGMCYFWNKVGPI